MVGRLLEAMRGVLLRIMYRFSPRDRAHGIQLIVSSADEHAAEFFRRVRTALDLIENNQPRRITQVSRYLDRIVLVNGGGMAYLHSIGACLVDVPTLRRKSDLDLASSLVHEATHGRIERKGIRYVPARRERIERVCIGESLDFLARADDDEAIPTRLVNAFDRPWWTPEALRARRLEELRSHGVPEWLVRLLGWLSRTLGTG